MLKFISWLVIPVIAVCFFALFLVPMMEKDPGYVLIAFAGQVIEMRFWMAALVLVVFFLLLWFLVSILKGTLRATIATFNWWPAQAQKQLWARQEKAMAALWEGNTKEAYLNFSRIAKTKSKKHDTLALVNAANTAIELRLFEEADHFLAQADNLEDKNHQVTLLVSKARLFYKQDNTEQALVLANQALAITATHAGVLTLLKEIYLKTEDWPALFSLLPRFKKAKIPDNKTPSLTVQVHAGLMRSAQNINELNQAWSDIPKAQKNAAVLMCCYAEQQLQLGSIQQAELWLRKAIKSDFNDALVNLYGQTPAEDASAQLQHAEKWLTAQPENGSLLLALGRIAQRNELWAKAKDYFQKSIAAQPSSAAYAELARLLAHLGEHKASTQLFQEGLLFSAGGSALITSDNTARDTENTPAIVTKN